MPLDPLTALQTALRGLQPLDLRNLEAAAVPRADTALIVFDRTRGRHGREDAFFQPEPQQLVELARWLRTGGVDSLALVLPHAPAMLPQALRHGLAADRRSRICGVRWDSIGSCNVGAPIRRG